VAITPPECFALWRFPAVVLAASLIPPSAVLLSARRMSGMEQVQVEIAPRTYPTPANLDGAGPSLPHSSLVPLYSPTLAAALSWNRLPARIYFLTMGRLLWPVWAMIARSLTPACAAAVARPARKECPA